MTYLCSRYPFPPPVIPALSFRGFQRACRTRISMPQDIDTVVMHRAMPLGVNRPRAAIYRALGAALHPLRDQGIPVRDPPPLPVVMHRAQAGSVQLALAAIDRA